jgi:hypothetical protein
MEDQGACAALLRPPPRRAGQQCDAGCSAWSEQFAVSLCISSANFKCVALHPSTLPPDPKRQYNHDAKVDEELFKELCTNPQTCHGVLLHAMKW